MLNIIEITDINSPALDIFARLTESQLRNRLCPEKALFIAESPKVIKVALERGYTPVSFLMERGHIEGDAKEIIESCPDAPVYTAEREILQKLTGYVLTRGVLCAMSRPSLPLPENVLQNARRVAVLENIVDSTNMGAIFRSAAALGVDAVLLTPSCSDPFNRRCVRVSMGTVFCVPFAYISENPSDWPSGIDFFKKHGFTTVAMALSDNSVSIDDEVLKQQEKLAIILGTEGDGLSLETIAKCDFTAKIPMSYGIDSLNVAAAGAVAFWELRLR